MNIGFSKKKIPDNLDYIIVGSGAGGLACGALLARSGRRVLVLEQHYIAGGCLHTFDEKGFEFDTGLHYIGKVKKYGTLLGLAAGSSLDFKQTGSKEDGYTYDRLVFSDADHFDLKAGGKDILRRSLLERFPSSKEDIDKLVGQLLASRFSEALPFIWRYIPRWIGRPLNMLTKLCGLHTLFASSTSAVLENSIRNPEIRSICLGNTGDEGGSPEDNCWLSRKGVFRHYLRDGGFYPVGGPAAISLALIEAIEKSGGRVLVRANVKKILVRGGKATGVVVSKAAGDVEISAKEGVIAACGAKVLYEDLLPGVREAKQQAAALSKIRQSASHISIFIGLKGSQEQLKLPSYNYWVLPNLDTKTGVYRSPMKEEAGYDPMTFPALGFMGFPSAKDPTYHLRCPGKSACCLITEAPYSFFSEWKGTKSGRRPKDYEALKKKIADKYISEVVLRLHPELKDAIDFVDVATPLTSQFYLGSKRGASYGLEQSRARFYDWGVQDALHCQTRIPNLYLTGQDVVTSGIAGAVTSAYFTASKILGYSFLEVLTGKGIVSDLKKITPKFRDSKLSSFI
eukprot:jgi/Bigna1/43354/e_gw1.77.8.1